MIDANAQSNGLSTDNGEEVIGNEEHKRKLVEFISAFEIS